MPIQLHFFNNYFNPNFIFFFRINTLVKFHLKVVGKCAILEEIIF